jgi:hypothetical protein
LIFYVSNHLLMFLGRFSLVKMLEWREREHEEEDYFSGMTRALVMALRSVVTQVFQNSGHESPTEIARVSGPHVGCE